MRTFQTGQEFKWNYTRSGLVGPWLRIASQQAIEPVRAAARIGCGEGARAAGVDSGAAQGAHEVAQVEHLAAVLAALELAGAEQGCP